MEDFDGESTLPRRCDQPRRPSDGVGWDEWLAKSFVFRLARHTRIIPHTTIEKTLTNCSSNPQAVRPTASLKKEFRTKTRPMVSGTTRAIVRAYRLSSLLARMQMAPEMTPQSAATPSDGHWGGASRNPSKARTPNASVSKPNFVRFMVSATGVSWLTLRSAAAGREPGRRLGRMVSRFLHPHWMRDTSLRSEQRTPIMRK